MSLATQRQSMSTFLRWLEWFRWKVGQDSRGSLTHLPRNVNNYGQPLMFGGQQFTTGNVFFVDTGATLGSDRTAGRHGLDPERPFATVDFAIGRCSANNGDVIIVMPGHVETLAAASAWNFDVAGITVIGLGVGADRPTLTFATAAGADIAISAANTRLQNLLLVCNITSQTAMIDIDVDGDGAVIENCEFREGSQTGLNFISITGVADDVQILNNKFYAPTAGNMNEAVILSAAITRFKFIGNYVYGDFDEACLQNPTSNVCTLMEVRDNNLTNLLAANHAIQLVSACTGMATNNHLSTDAIGTSFDTGALRCANNHWSSSVADVGGSPTPINSDYNPLLGYRVQKADFDTPNAAVTAMFTIAGGRIMVTRLVGEVGTVISAAANATKITANPTTGNSVDLCSTLDINGFDAATLLNCECDGTAMLGSDGGSAALGSLGISSAEVDIGVIDLDCAGTTTGTTKWDLWYWPLEDGATVVST